MSTSPVPAPVGRSENGWGFFVFSALFLLPSAIAEFLSFFKVQLPAATPQFLLPVIAVGIFLYPLLLSISGLLALRNILQPVSPRCKNASIALLLLAALVFFTVEHIVWPG